MANHNRTGKPAPIEIDPSDDGNISITGDRYEVVPAEEREGYRLRRRGMPCEEFNGAVICRGRRARPKKCEFCGRLDTVALCDFPAEGGTCDRRICVACGDHVKGANLDYCPEHEREQWDHLEPGLVKLAAEQLVAALNN